MATVAIVTPIYATPENGRLDLFYATLNSVRNQAGNRPVHIIVDDGSTVDVKEFLRQYGSPMIRYLRREKQKSDLDTSSNPLNTGIDNILDDGHDLFTRSERQGLQAVAMLHSDDLLSPNSIERRVIYLNGGFVHTHMGFINSEDVIYKVRSGRDAHNLRNLKYASGHCRFIFNSHTIVWGIDFLRGLRDFTATEYEQDGIFDPQLRYGEDLDMFLSAAAFAIDGGYDIAYSPSVSMYHRTHPQSITGSGDGQEFLRSQKIRIRMKHRGDNLPHIKERIHGFLFTSPSNTTTMPEQISH